MTGFLRLADRIGGVVIHEWPWILFFAVVVATFWGLGEAMRGVPSVTEQLTAKCEPHGGVRTLQLGDFWNLTNAAVCEDGTAVQW